jgi:hypothetical protein
VRARGRLRFLLPAPPVVHQTPDPNVVVDPCLPDGRRPNGMMAPYQEERRARILIEASRTKARAKDVDPAIKLKAKELGRIGGLKGGKARAAKLTPQQRSEIARHAAWMRHHGKSILKGKKK